MRPYKLKVLYWLKDDYHNSLSWIKVNTLNEALKAKQKLRAMGYEVSSVFTSRD